MSENLPTNNSDMINPHGSTRVDKPSEWDRLVDGGKDVADKAKERVGELRASAKQGFANLLKGAKQRAPEVGYAALGVGQKIAIETGKGLAKAGGWMKETVKEQFAKDRDIIKANLEVARNRKASRIQERNAKIQELEFANDENNSWVEALKSQDSPRDKGNDISSDEIVKAEIVKANEQIAELERSINKANLEISRAKARRDDAEKDYKNKEQIVNEAKEALDANPDNIDAQLAFKIAQSEMGTAGLKLEQTENDLKSKNTILEEATAGLEQAGDRRKEARNRMIENAKWAKYSKQEREETNLKILENKETLDKLLAEKARQERLDKWKSRVGKVFKFIKKTARRFKKNAVEKSAPVPADTSENPITPDSTADNADPALWDTPQNS